MAPFWVLAPAGCMTAKVLGRYNGSAAYEIQGKRDWL